MIRISLGGVGSGKTAMEVREMTLNKTHRKSYSNIVTKLKDQITLRPDMIIKKNITGHKKNGEPITELKLNVDFWKSVEKPINIILDEAHSIINSRRAMSKINIIMTDWLSLIRRVIGAAESGYGEVVFITQLPGRIDNIIREMATQIRYHVCHYIKSCINCGTYWNEHSEQPERLWTCPSCGHWKIKKHNHIIEVWHFSSIQNYEGWKEGWSPKGFYKHYFVTDIEEYFDLYDTFQWDNLFSDF